MLFISIMSAYFDRVCICSCTYMGTLPLIKSNKEILRNLFLLFHFVFAAAHQQRHLSSFSFDQRSYILTHQWHVTIHQSKPHHPSSQSYSLLLDQDASLPLQWLRLSLQGNWPGLGHPRLRGGRILPHRMSNQSMHLYLKGNKHGLYEKIEILPGEKYRLRPKYETKCNKYILQKEHSMTWRPLDG